jgi:hypothetical protein
LDVISLKLPSAVARHWGFISDMTVKIFKKQSLTFEGWLPGPRQPQEATQVERAVKGKGVTTTGHIAITVAGV